MFEVLEYITTKGESPLADWLRGLDAPVWARVRTRIDRLARGNFGDAKSIGGGIFELRLDFGPGYRVYFGRQGSRVVILLCGGDKGSQSSDITKAKQYWADCKAGANDGNSKLLRVFKGGA